MRIAANRDWIFIRCGCELCDLMRKAFDYTDFWCKQSSMYINENIKWYDGQSIWFHPVEHNIPKCIYIQYTVNARCFCLCFNKNNTHKIITCECQFVNLYWWWFQMRSCSFAPDKWFEKLKSPTTTFGFSGINISAIVMYSCDGKNDFSVYLFYIYVSFFFKFHFNLNCWFVSFDFSFFYPFLFLFWLRNVYFVLCWIGLDKYGKLVSKIHRYFSLMQLTASTAAAAAATKQITAHQQCLQMQHELDVSIYI